MVKETKQTEENDGCGIAFFMFMLTLGLVGYNDMESANNRERLKQDHKDEVGRLAYQIIRKYDIDKDGLDSDESKRLIRDIGYGNSLPPKNLVFKFKPGDYATGEVVMELSNHSPIGWKDDYRFPKQRLTTLIRRPQRR